MEFFFLFKSILVNLAFLWGSKQFSAKLPACQALAEDANRNLAHRNVVFFVYSSSP
jgi:hypothetical protein